MRIAAAALVAAMLALVAAPAAASLEEALAALKEGGRVLLMRHATTEPGVGDPPDFDLDDWTTQRNLDARGRAEARRLGEAIGAAGIRIDRALSSAWRRCGETAEILLAAAGQPDVPVETFEPLNSFFQDRGAAERRSREAREAVAGWNGEGVLLMSTHMVNIYGMIERSPPQGGFFVLAPTADGFRIVAAAAP